MTYRTLERRVDSYFSHHFTGTFSQEDRILERYATDMSVYRIRPAVVLFPASEQDIVAALAFAHEEHLPVTPRGGGSSTGGGAVGSGLMVVLSPDAGFKHTPREGDPFSRIGPPESHASGISLRAGAAVRHSDLQQSLHREGHFLPADPTSGAISCIGGNIATRASGPHALRHGSIDRYLRNVRFVTAAGQIVDTANPGSLPASLKAEIQRVQRLVQTDARIRERIARTATMKSASGYTLSPFLENLPVERLITNMMVGQAGTLGIVTAAELSGIPRPEKEASVLLGFSSLERACNAVPTVLATDPAAIEIMNGAALRIAGEKGRYRRELHDAVSRAVRHPAVLLVEYTGDDTLHCIRSLEQLFSHSSEAAPDEFHAAETKEEREALWSARKGLLPAVRNYGRHFKALSVVNDVGVPVERLAQFIREAEACFARNGLEAAIYGHAGNGNLHLRPLFDIRRSDLIPVIQRVADDIYSAVLRFDGTITGEHGMGRLRAPYLRAEWGEDVYRIMQQIKSSLDAEDILNPGCMFSDRPISTDLDSEFLRSP